MNKHNGFRSVFYGAIFVFNIQTSIACFSETSKRCYVKIKRIEDVDMQALFMYDAPQCLASNDTLSGLSKWFRMIGSHACVAIDSEGIVGYTVARPTNDWSTLCRFRCSCRKIVETSVWGASSARKTCFCGLHWRPYREGLETVQKAPRKEIVWVGGVHGHEWSPWRMFCG